MFTLQQQFNNWLAGQWASLPLDKQKEWNRSQGWIDPDGEKDDKKDAPPAESGDGELPPPADGEEPPAEDDGSTDIFGLFTYLATTL